MPDVKNQATALIFAGSAALNKGWEQRSFLALGLITYSLSLFYCMHLSAAAQMCWLELHRESQYSALLLTLIHWYCPNSFWNKCFSLFFIPFESVHLDISSEQRRKSLLPFRGCMLPSSSWKIAFGLLDCQNISLCHPQKHYYSACEKCVFHLFYIKLVGRLTYSLCIG